MAGNRSPKAKPSIFAGTPRKARPSVPSLLHPVRGALTHHKFPRCAPCSNFAMSATSTATARGMPVAAAPAPHTLTEDAVAIFTGVLLISVGVAFFASAGLLTGGTAGLAFLLHYATGVGFGKIFFALNLPFYWLALRKLGRAFTFKTFAAVLLLSV